MFHRRLSDILAFTFFQLSVLQCSLSTAEDAINVLFRTGHSTVISKKTTNFNVYVCMFLCECMPCVFGCLQRPERVSALLELQTVKLGIELGSSVRARSALNH